jgi:hypothetical protein
MPKLIAHAVMLALFVPSLVLAVESDCEDASDYDRSLEDAIDQAEGSNRRVTFVLADDCTLGDELELNGGKLIIVGEGFTISFDDYEIRVVEGGQLSINDAVLDGEFVGVIALGADLILNDVDSLGVFVGADASASLTINGGTISDTGTRGVGIGAGSVATVNGTVISDNRWGLIVVQGGEASLNAVTITGSDSEGIVFQGGGSVSLNKGTVVTDNDRDGIRTTPGTTVAINADACVVGNADDDLDGSAGGELFVSRRATIGTCTGFDDCPDDVDSVSDCALID